MITYSTYTDIGERQINEDSLKVVDLGNKKLFVVADGLGGHGRGEVASGLVVDALERQFNEKSRIKMFLEEGVQSAQEELLAEQERLHAENEMKTTIVGLMIDKNKAKWIHCGDSRLYMFYKNKVEQKTIDHSLLQALIKANQIKAEDYEKYADRNILLQVMGTEWDLPQYSVSKLYKVKKCQAFLLCSDGFWELIDEAEMERLLKESSTVQEWLERMRAVVQENDKGINMDNNTAIAVWCEG